MCCLLFTILTILGAQLSAAHSWCEQLTVIGDGVFETQYGFSRGYVDRNSPGFQDDLMVNLLPPLDSGRVFVNDEDVLCSPTQRAQNQTDNFPRLQSPAGSFVALRYLENGHVTLPQPGKPKGSGKVHVLGTSKPLEQRRLVDALQWTPDGNGGDGQGRLLSVQYFDDGRCHQINDGPISMARQTQFPNSAHELWCETDIQLPTDLPTGSLYTIYWVWDWATSPGAAGLPDGKDEYYTACSDVQIVEGLTQAEFVPPLAHQDPQNAPVGNFKERARQV